MKPGGTGGKASCSVRFRSCRADATREAQELAVAAAAGVLNALLLPVVLWFLYRLARRDLPADLRLRGVYAVAVAWVFTAVAGLGLYAGIASAW